MRASLCNPIPVAAGIGLRFPHYRHVREHRPQVAWLEVHSENFLGGGALRALLTDLRRDYPLSLHGVALSLGSAEGLDAIHLARLAELVRDLEPAAVSEHLSWSVAGGRYFADLLPLPLTEEALDVVARHVMQTQERLARPILIENPSTYLQFEHSTIPEWEFLATLAARTGCGILCDVNNIYVSAENHGWDAQRYLRGLAPGSVAEIHLAGHAVRELEGGGLLRLDHHGAPVAPAVWALYLEALRRFGPRPTLIEWDTDIPPLDVLLEQAAQAGRMLEEARINAAA